MESVDPLDPDAAQRIHEIRAKYAREMERRGALPTQPHFSSCYCCCDDCLDLEDRVEAWEDLTSGNPGHV